MSRKNKKSAWKKRNEEAVRIETKRLEELRKKRREKKVVVKGKNLKRMGVIPKGQRLQKLKRTAEDMIVDGDNQPRPSKRRRKTPVKKDEDDGMVDVAKDIGERPVEETTIAKWMGKELQYDWSKTKKFQGFRPKEFKEKLGMREDSGNVPAFKQPEGDYVFKLRSSSLEIEVKWHYETLMRKSLLH